MAPSEEGAVAPEGYKGATEGEITRGRCLHYGVDKHRVENRSFAFYLAYIKCFRTYSVYLSLRLPAQILYAGIHLCPLAVLRSCFGYSLSHLRTAAACLSRCIRHRRRSKAKPLRGRRGGYRRKATDSLLCAAPLSKLFRLEPTPIKNEENPLLAKQLFLIFYFEHRFEHGKILLEHGLSTAPSSPKERLSAAPPLCTPSIKNVRAQRALLNFAAKGSKT